MTRIVTTHYRYKPPPKKRKAVALEVPVVVTAKRSRHPLRGSKRRRRSCRASTKTRRSSQAHRASERASPGQRRSEAEPRTAEAGDRHQHQPQAGEATARLATRTSGAGRADDPKDEALMKAMARMIRPPGAG